VHLALSAHHRVLAPDQLGFGASDKPIIDYGIQTWVDFLGEFLRVEKVEDFTLAASRSGDGSPRSMRCRPWASSPRTRPWVFQGPGASSWSTQPGTSTWRRAFAAGGPGLSLASSKALLSAVYHEAARSSDAAARDQFALSLSKGDGWTIHSLLSNRTLVAECVDEPARPDHPPDARCLGGA